MRSDLTDIMSLAIFDDIMFCVPLNTRISKIMNGRFRCEVRFMGGTGYGNGTAQMSEMRRSHSTG